MKARFFNNPFLFAAPLLLAMLTNITAQAQLGGVPVWTNRYNGPANADDLARAMVVDSSGNVLVTGSSTGSGSGLDYATIKYSATGVALWTNLYNGPGNGDDVAKAIAVDGTGNVFVTGFSAGIGVGRDYTTVGYSSAGVALWTNRYHGAADGNNEAVAVAADGSGNVLVTGFSAGANGYYSYATIKYSGAGVPLWTNRYHGPASADDTASALAVDSTGNVFVTGFSASTYFETIKYSSTGAPLWTNGYGPTYGAPAAVAVDRSGDVFVTGTSGGEFATLKYTGAGLLLWTNVGGGPGSTRAIVVDGTGNVFVTGDSHFHIGDSIYETKKYSSSGVVLWTAYYFSSFGNPSDYPTAMAVDASGNVFVTGYSGNYGGAHDYATVAYSAAGAQLWVNRYNGPGNGDDRASGLAEDGSGNVFVTGYSTGIGSGYDFATIKYSLIPPRLAIVRTATNTLAVSWPSPSTDFILQQNTDGITTVNWSNVVGAPSDDGMTRAVIVAPPAGNRFYRLLHP
ncbi:MAG TPA: SBBP repeat-containing protein [Candidatus Dormibacteraeota bacterium]|nr:SBBP repeat-containing protein [Candidatus Dormibacteraeota bacterium]